MHGCIYDINLDDGNTVELQPISGWKDVDHTYINASYIDVSNLRRDIHFN